MNQATTLKTDWPVNITRHGWLGAEITKERQSFDLGTAELGALRELIGKCTAAGRSYTDITREEFSHPALNLFLGRMTEELKWGKGLVFLRGVPVDNYTLDEIRMLYWGIGTHLGTALCQSVVGDRMGDVTPREGASRGYASNQELDLHTDYTEIAALLCVHPAKSGGMNIFASSLAIWDIVEREHPEFIPILMRGFKAWRFDEHREGQDPMTPYHVPVFGEEDGLRSVYWFWVTADAAARFVGEPLTASETACIKFLYEVAGREELRFSDTLQRGEAVFFSNYEVLHSRTAFVQWEDRAKSRHLLRLWLQCTPKRPIPEKMKFYENPSGGLGYDIDPRRIGQEYVKLSDNPASRFMKEYLAEFYTGKISGMKLIMKRLEESQ